ncbi:MAG: ribose 5-phosphate isomerase B [Ignavibacteria bacterium GWF2_33_9]|nr:MAG: ribose 5-phosphate isomerase B [Ignavibacteria bacterium GWF2_33_9]
MKIALASDHAAYDMKEKIKEFLNSREIEWEDFGTFSNDSVDYPDFAIPAAESVAGNYSDIGIIICGTGIGMSIAANKVKGVRAALCCTEDTAILSRQHNNANVLCFGARTNSWENAQIMITAFLTTEFEGDRHIRRLDKIQSYEC